MLILIGIVLCGIGWVLSEQAHRKEDDGSGLTLQRPDSTGGWLMGIGIGLFLLGSLLGI